MMTFNMKDIKFNLSLLKFYPLITTRWKDLEKLFGERGACGGCWCMSWRLKNSDYEKNKGERNKKAFKEIVNKGNEPGIIAYFEKEPVAWCAIAPRDEYLKLENSRVLKRIDEKPVWSITCLFIARQFRRKGISIALLKAVIDYCRNKKVEVIEAYPVIPYTESMPEAFAWTGIYSAYLKAGFKDMPRFSPSRPIMRYYLK
jgi:GNAT superfamily N-acetyltransferase